MVYYFGMQHAEVKYTMKEILLFVNSAVFVLNMYTFTIKSIKKRLLKALLNSWNIHSLYVSLAVYKNSCIGIPFQVYFLANNSSSVL